MSCSAPTDKESMPIRILIADDHKMMRDGLRAMLEDQEDLRVVAEARNGEEAIRLVERHSPDVVLMDITMPVLDGIEATRRIASAHPGVRVVALTMHTTRQLIDAMVRAGAASVVRKDASFRSLVKAVRASPSGSSNRPRAAGLPENPLTPREREVLAAIAQGECVKEIAWRLGISPKTVETHLGHVMSKLGIRTVAGLTRHALAHGLVSI